MKSQHGSLTSNLFWSDIMDNSERCFVYTPADYSNDQKNYPVVYMLNGGTDNETSWNNVGMVSNIFDNLIAEKKAVPFIAVMINSMLRKDGRISLIRDDGFDKMLTEDVIPFVEKHYRTRNGKKDRAIAGLSMGAYMTADIAFGHPELFGYVGTFTACISLTKEQINEQYAPNHIDRPQEKYFVTHSADDFEKDFKIFYCSTTPQEDHLDLFLADDKRFNELSYTNNPGYIRHLYDEKTSKWNSWRMGIRDFVKLIFR